MILTRRTFLLTMTGVIAAPAVIRVARLMPVKAIERVPAYERWDEHGRHIWHYSDNGGWWEMDISQAAIERMLR